MYDKYILVSAEKSVRVFQISANNSANGNNSSISSNENDDNSNNCNSSSRFRYEIKSMPPFDRSDFLSFIFCLYIHKGICYAGSTNYVYYFDLTKTNHEGPKKKILVKNKDASIESKVNSLFVQDNIIYAGVDSTIQVWKFESQWKNVITFVEDGRHTSINSIQVARNEIFAGYSNNKTIVRSAKSFPLCLFVPPFLFNRGKKKLLLVLALQSIGRADRKICQFVARQIFAGTTYKASSLDRIRR